MPNLKAALASHTHNAKRIAAAKKAEANKHDKAASVKASMSGAKKAAKRRARLEREKELAAGAKSGSSGDIKSSVGAGVSKSETTAGAEEAEGMEQDATTSTTSTHAPTAGTSGTSTVSVRPTIPFSKSDTILFLGEANFSFALSVLVAHHHPAHQVLATSYDSEETCYAKYPDAADHVKQLRDAGAGVEFGVDGGRLEGCKKVGKGRWSRVIMNFPHTGSGIKDQDRNIRDNQLLLLRVLRSVGPVLTVGPANMLPNSHTGLKRKKQVSGKDKSKNAKRRKAESSDEEDVAPIGSEDVSDMSDAEGDDNNPEYLPPVGSTSTSRELNPPNVPGTLLITLLDQPPYTLWALRQLATRPPASIPNAKPSDRGPQPRYALLRSFQFVPQIYPGYAHRRTLGFKEGLSKDGNAEIVGRKGIPRTWEFALNPKLD